MNTSRNVSRLTRRTVWLALPLLILAVGVIAALWLLESQPSAPRAKAQQRQARLVTVTPAEAAPATLDFDANGTVEAADATTLRARVSGQIVALTDKLAPGTRFEKDEVLARIDDADYRLALNSTRTDLANARAALRVEQGQQAVAERELSLVGTEVSADERDLALRGPQLEQAKADVEAARTAVEQAQLDLDRTTVRAPFTGIVTERSASLGDVVATSDTLATLAATEAYWVNVSLPVDQLRFIHAAGSDRAGTPAQIYYPDAWGDDAFLPAEVLRIQPALETSGRMARVLLQVPDPLGDNTPADSRLLIGAYVRAALEARIPTGSVLVDSAFVHENNNVWVMTDENRLDIRSVDILYRDANQTVIASGLAPGDAVITSELTAPIQGLPIRVESATVDEQAPDDAPDREATSLADQTGNEADHAVEGVARSLRLTGPPADAGDAVDGSRQARARAHATEPRS
ncbi:efflux RND transporter periplasmic adaptor subunit [Endozoicomonas sp. G2_2]|uniref:efflux RND transporter periplasmic adaptor subunit n=1 Tax=Endozoicomonas sp. G2_2 TaxID=2821092 RepID=UPI001ADD04FC|nr:efflux RND transporter periplasmic adaptor subunit [Endozoicomonas sp. G2_2]MBO9468876.1 efflux RND transporter periplasmic adaptor subunit [Endozoicomonas sp. G2_2]